MVVNFGAREVQPRTAVIISKTRMAMFNDQKHGKRLSDDVNSKDGCAAKSFALLLA